MRILNNFNFALDLNYFTKIMNFILDYLILFIAALTMFMLIFYTVLFIVIKIKNNKKVKIC